MLKDFLHILIIFALNSFEKCQISNEKLFFFLNKPIDRLQVVMVAPYIEKSLLIINCGSVSWVIFFIFGILLYYL